MGTTMDPSTLPYKVYDIDPDGDLLLGTKPDHEARWRFRVCSATLRRHSPVWKTMLFGPWKEAKPTDDSEWVVELPEDPAFEMQTTFHIIHGLFDKVPETMSINNLFNLLIVLNKYDMTRIVKPWCTQWVLPAEQPLAAVHALRSMYIAWELGHESLFTSRLAEIAMKTEIEGGALVFNDFQDVNLEAQDYLGPSDILGAYSIHVWSHQSHRIYC